MGDQEHTREHTKQPVEEHRPLEADGLEGEGLSIAEADRPEDR